MGEKLSDYSYSVKKANERKVANFIVFFLLIFVFINLAVTFLVFPVRQVSASMAPDFPENSIVMVTPLVNGIQRGDVVLMNTHEAGKIVSPAKKMLNLCIRFFTAQQYDPESKDGMPGSKNKLRRIVGMPGDTIYMRDYVLYVKPAGDKHFLTEFEISDKIYDLTFYVAPGDWDSSLGVKGSFDEIKLGRDEYFVLGDNRKACDDSRLWGTVSASDFKAKTLFCYFPFNNIKLF